jgi:hypothetical protein
MIIILFTSEGGSIEYNIIYLFFFYGVFSFFLNHDGNENIRKASNSCKWEAGR